MGLINPFPVEDPNKSLVTKAFQGLGNMFGNIFSNLPKQATGQGGNVSSGLARNPYYQVTSSDTGMDSVANATGVDLNTLVNANGGMKTLPPVGSYIATQNSNMALQPQTTMMANGLNNGAGTLGATNKSTYKDARGIITSPIISAREDVNKSFNQFNEMYRLTGQVDTSMLPTSINLATIKALDAKGFFPATDSLGNPLTPASALQQYGYSWDAKQGKFVQSGTPGGANQNKPKLGTVAGQVMDNKFVLVNKNGKLKWVNMNKQGPEVAPVKKAGPAANAATTAQTVLGLNVGSG